MTTSPARAASTTGPAPEDRARARSDDCVLLALVTSTDIAASLIDRAIALHAGLTRPEPTYAL